MRSVSLGLFAILALAGCGSAPPRIGSGLPGPSRQVQADFDQRVRTRFPIGSDEAALHNELLREKFVIVRGKDSPFMFFARYYSSLIVCRDNWTIQWSVFAGRVADIAGYWEEICL
jgi:hypothetical protein